MKDVGVCFELVTQELRNSWEGGLGGFCIPAFREFAIHVQETGHLCPGRLYHHPEYFSEESQTVVHLQHSSRGIVLVCIVEHLLSKGSPEAGTGKFSKHWFSQTISYIWSLDVGVGFWCVTYVERLYCCEVWQGPPEVFTSHLPQCARTVSISN